VRGSGRRLHTPSFDVWRAIPGCGCLLEGTGAIKVLGIHAMGCWPGYHPTEVWGTACGGGVALHPLIGVVTAASVRRPLKLPAAGELLRLAECDGFFGRCAVMPMAGGC